MMGVQVKNQVGAVATNAGGGGCPRPPRRRGQRSDQQGREGGGGGQAPVVKQELVVVKKEVIEEERGQERPPEGRGGEGQGFKEKLKDAMAEVLSTLRKCPDSEPFLVPVDIKRLKVPDYYQIVKNPMDLSTIDKKLNDDEYADPWMFIKDMQLMFDNCFLYNQVRSPVHTNGVRLQKVFNKESNQMMREAGYCCGELHYILPGPLECCANQCTIRRNDRYYYLQEGLDEDSRLCLCCKCYIGNKPIKIKEAPPKQDASSAVKAEEEVQVTERILTKWQFTEETTNSKRDVEEFLDCNICGRKLHAICSKYLKELWPHGFTCTNCRPNNSDEYRARSLPRSKLGDHLETRLNNYLETQKVGGGVVGYVSVRVVSDYEKCCVVKPEMKGRFVDTKQFPGQFQYRSKAIYAFEEIEGVDLCFFGMYVQEYGPECPPPNTRRVYIAYMDSIHFFQPRQLRTEVYYEILLGYLEYSKRRGFTTAHIWACPPKKGDDYIFNCHPSDQKFPTPKRLQEWYSRMLDKGIIEQTVLEYKEVLQASVSSSKCLPLELPYFDDDIWPTLLEDSIREVCTAETRLLNQRQRPRPAQNRRRNRRAGDKKRKAQPNPLDLQAILEARVQNQQKLYFAINLFHQEWPMPDKDVPINSDLMNNRDSFLQFCRLHSYEFSSVRRSIHSTKCILYELHRNSGNVSPQLPEDQNQYPCDMEIMDEKPSIEALDSPSSNREPTNQKEVSVQVQDSTSTSQWSKGQIVVSIQNSPAEREIRKVQHLTKVLKCLVHSASCNQSNCHDLCNMLKVLFLHVKECPCRRKCVSYCRWFMGLCKAHARTCKINKCKVPFCTQIRHPSGKCATQNNPDSTRLQANIRNNKIADLKQDENLDPVRLNGHAAVGLPSAALAPDMNQASSQSQQQHHKENHEEFPATQRIKEMAQLQKLCFQAHYFSNEVQRELICFLNNSDRLVQCLSECRQGKKRKTEVVAEGDMKKLKYGIQ